MQQKIATISQEKTASPTMLVDRLTYEIATGAREPGERLPSVRRAGQDWGVDPRTVLKAYQKLEKVGLVKGADRSGYSVAPAEKLERVTRHRHELERHFERVATEIEASTGLDVLGVLRYFEQLAERRARERPACLFVECSRTQAAMHAREVVNRLDTPCLAMSLSEIDGAHERVPTHVRTVLVTTFHFGELKDLRCDELRVVSVPIEVSPLVVQSLAPAPSEHIIVETDRTEGESIQRDVQRLGPTLRTRVVVSQDPDETLSTLIGEDPAPSMEEAKAIVLLSPRVWGRVDPTWRANPVVRQIEYRVVARAWPEIADAIGLPLGVLG